MEYRLVRSLDNLYKISEDGTELIRVKDGLVIHPRIKHERRSHATYFETRLLVHGERRHVYIHRLVAECWLGNKPNGLVTDHIDRNSLNNRYDNLRYVTHSENNRNRAKK